MPTSHTPPLTASLPEDFSFEAAIGIKTPHPSLTAHLAQEGQLEGELARLPPMPKAWLDIFTVLARTKAEERKDWQPELDYLAMEQPISTLATPEHAATLRLRFYNLFRYIQRPRNASSFPLLSASLVGIKMAVRGKTLVFYTAKPPAAWPEGVLVVGGKTGEGRE